MELHIEARIDGGVGSYDSGQLVRHEQKATVVEVDATTKIPDVTPDDVEAVRDRLHGALKDAGKRLDADLDVVLERAEERAKAARDERRARESEHAV